MSGSKSSPSTDDCWSDVERVFFKEPPGTVSRLAEELDVALMVGEEAESEDSEAVSAEERFTLLEMAVARVAMPKFDRELKHAADREPIVDRSDQDYYKQGQYDADRYGRLAAENRDRGMVAYKVLTQGRVASREDGL